MATPRCCMLTECRRFRLAAQLRLFLVLLRSETCIGRAVWLALFVVLPVTVAAGYASFLFPIYSDNLGLLKSDINNIYVLGQLIVYVCIDSILGAERHRGAHRLVTMSVVLLGIVLALFAINTTFLWSAAVVVIVALLCKSAESWKPLWIRAALDAGVPVGRSVGTLFTTRNLTLIAQPFILGALLGYNKIDGKWKKDLELSDVILEIADDLCHGCQMSEYSHYNDPEWSSKYIHMHRPDRQDSERSKGNGAPGSPVTRLVQGDITTISDVDAIVNAANRSLLGGGGVDGAIHRAAGPKLLEECRKLNGCETGKAKLTGAYNLPCRYVIHTVGPVWRGGKNHEEELLAGCYWNSLQTAVDHKIRSVAFPSISTGVYRFPVEKAAEIAVRTVDRFVGEHPGALNLIEWVLFDEKTYHAYKEALDRLEVSKVINSAKLDEINRILRDGLL